jgi:outer membrane lipoprotein-sorting protein
MLKKIPMLFALALFAVLSPLALAQDLSADEILANLEARNNALQDASFLLTGIIYDTDGQEIALEVESQFIPGEELAKAYFIQPDALADNFIVADGETVYNYLFVTNQVTILNANDPEALGGLLPEGEVEGGVNLTPNLGRFFSSDNWEATVEGYEESPEGPVYRLRFDNVDETANLDYVTATVLDAEWLPQTLTFVQQDGSPLAELQFQDYALDTGLDPAELRELPGDAERIDER